MTTCSPGLWTTLWKGGETPDDLGTPDDSTAAAREILGITGDNRWTPIPLVTCTDAPPSTIPSPYDYDNLFF